jgi:hypothetical protein
MSHLIEKSSTASALQLGGIRHSALRGLPCDKSCPCDKANHAANELRHEAENQLFALANARRAQLLSQPLINATNHEKIYKLL